MLLDSYALRKEMSTLLSPAPAGFTKRVSHCFQKIDTLLKTLQVRASPPEALIQAYLIHIADKSDANFRRILEIKGIRSKQEQGSLVELFQLHRNSDRHAPNLQQSNPLVAQLQPPPPSSAHAPPGPGGASTTASSHGTSTARFDASTLGSALISAARDGVDRLGTGGLGGPGGAANASGGPGGVGGPASGPTTQSGTGTPPFGQGTTIGVRGEGSDGGSATANLNENLKNIGKFFRRDVGGFGGRFGKSDER